MNALSPAAHAFINRFQGGFPVCAGPFERAARQLGMNADDMVDLVRTLVSGGWLSRFGPVYNASRLGGAQTLAALKVPAARFDEVARVVNAFDEVAHNYRREHRLNMWFVIAAEKPGDLPRVLSDIERVAGLAVYDFPKLREFYLGLKLRLDEDGTVATVPAEEPGARSGYVLDEFDRALMVVTQEGLPLVSEPYAALAEGLGTDEVRVHERFDGMLDHGVVRRIGAVPNHYRLGLVANGMTVWDVPDEVLAQAGAEVARLPFVSHCYERTRHDGIWPYNLFAMVHGTSRAEVAEKTACIAELLGPRCRARDVLVSTACLKKTGLRLAA